MGTLISELELSRVARPDVGRDRAGAFEALWAVTADQEAQARALAWPNGAARAAAAAGGDDSDLLQLRLLHSACELAKRAVLVHQVLEQLTSELAQDASSDAGASAHTLLGARESARAACAAIEKEIVRREEAAALVLCERAQEWLDRETKGDDEEMLRELAALELGAAANPGAAAAVD